MSLSSWPPLFFYYCCQSLGHIGNTTVLQTFLVVKSWSLQILPSSTGLTVRSFRDLSPAAPLPRGCNAGFLGKRDETCLHAKGSGVSLADMFMSDLQTELVQRIYF